MLPWRESASLILAAGNPLKILLMQRGSGGSFSKNMVFPGGVVHPDDLSTKWEALIPQAARAKVIIPVGATRSPCLENKPDELPREIGFRLTAIRETFEESGILLAQPRSIVTGMKDSLSHWRKKILDDGSHFFDMCRSTGIHPDIEALKIWSNWLTPTELPGKRFDTVFFVAEGDEATQVELSEDEMVGFSWTTPMAALGSGLSGKVRLAPPQIYEFSRLVAFSSAESLLDFAEARQKFGCALTFPIRVRCLDGSAMLFPDDDGYPTEPDFFGQNPPLTSEKTLEEFRREVKYHHRVEGDNDNIRFIKAFHVTRSLQPHHCDPVSMVPAISLDAQKDNGTGHYVRFELDLENITPQKFKFNFRFRNHPDFMRFLAALGIPARISCSNGTRVSGSFALAVVLSRLAFPNRWGDRVDFLGREITQLSRIFNTTIDLIYARHGYLLESLDKPWLRQADIERYAQVIRLVGSYFDNCWGFIDGTCREICRPGVFQWEHYSGHCRAHVVKFQSIVTPDGLIVNLWGPCEGRRHDPYMLNQSNMRARLAAKNAEWDRQYCIYGDKGYAISPEIQTPFRGPGMTQEEKEMNKAVCPSSRG